MPELDNLGRLLLVTGIVLVLVGGLLLVGGRLPFLGRLPGDIRIQQDGFSCFIPLMTSLLLSLLLTVVLNLIFRSRE